MQCMQTHLYLYLYLPLPKTGHMTPIYNFGGESAGGNKTDGTAGCGDTGLVSPAAWPPQCSRGTHLWACKAHEVREVGYGHV